MRLKRSKLFAFGVAIGFFLLLMAGCTVVVQPPAGTGNAPAAGSTTDPAAPPVIDLPGEFSAIQLIMTLDPGAWTPVHKHSGPGMITVLEGVMTVRNDQGVETQYHQGETWYEVPELWHQAGNSGTTTAKI